MLSLKFSQDMQIQVNWGKQTETLKIFNAFSLQFLSHPIFEFLVSSGPDSSDQYSASCRRQIKANNRWLVAH